MSTNKHVQELQKLAKEHDSVAKKKTVCENQLRKLNDQLHKIDPTNKGWQKLIQGIEKVAAECQKLNENLGNIYRRKLKAAAALAK